jgi:molecular chaperone IbpA
MVHQGIPSASFKQSFNLADHVKVTGASLENGLLTIDLAREAPEQLKPRRLEIVSGKDTKVSSQKPVGASAALQNQAA